MQIDLPMAIVDDNRGELTNFLANNHLSPDVLGLMVMQHMDCNELSMSVKQKDFWTRVAHEIGPDWIAQWRLVGDFMDKVSEF